MGFRKKWVEWYIKDLFTNDLFGLVQLNPREGGAAAKAEVLGSDWAESPADLLV